MVPRFMVRAEGLEPPTLWFEAKCSIQLSYARISTERRNSTRFLDPGQKIVHHTAVEQSHFRPVSVRDEDWIVKMYFSVRRRYNRGAS